MKKIILFFLSITLISCTELLHVLDAVSKTQSVGITDLDIANGLKEALNKGVEKEVSKLTQNDGFLGNGKVKIIFPKDVLSVERKLRNLGLGYLPDKGIELLNRAAENAVKEATPIFISAVKNMSITDARKILMGNDSSATSYLQLNTSDSLYRSFYPVVESSLSKVGADVAWSNITNKYNAIPFVTKVNPDIKDYVTTMALESVFKMILIEEKAIRNNLQERSSDLLKKVFALQDKL